jgi:hypothetical protein
MSTAWKSIDSENRLAVVSSQGNNPESMGFAFEVVKTL